MNKKEQFKLLMLQYPKNEEELYRFFAEEEAKEIKKEKKGKKK